MLFVGLQGQVDNSERLSIDAILPHGALRLNDSKGTLHSVITGSFWKRCRQPASTRWTACAGVAMGMPWKCLSAIRSSSPETIRST